MSQECEQGGGHGSMFDGAHPRWTKTISSPWEEDAIKWEECHVMWLQLGDQPIIPSDDAEA